MVRGGRLLNLNAATSANTTDSSSLDAASSSLSPQESNTNNSSTVLTEVPANNELHLVNDGKQFAILFFGEKLYLGGVKHLA